MTPLNRRSFVSLLLFAGLLAMVLRATPPVSVTILNTGDLHENIHTISRIAASKKQRREKGDNVLLLDAGDLFNRGDRAFMLSRGKSMFKLMANSGYDGGVLGNHGLSFGTRRTARLIEETGFPLLDVATVWPEGRSPKNASPYRIFAFAGLRVGVIGASSRHLNHDIDKLVRRLPILPEVLKVLPEVRRQADIVILLTHMGTAYDRKLATQLAEAAKGEHWAGVDVIIGGHDHALSRELDYDPVSDTIIQHAGGNGTWLGELILTWDGKQITERKSRMIRLTKDLPEDPEVAELIRQQQVQFPLNQPFANIEHDLSRSDLNAWFAKILQQQFDVDVVLLPTNTFKNGLEPGTATLDDLLKLLSRFAPMKAEVAGKKELETLIARQHALCNQHKQALKGATTPKQKKKLGALTAWRQPWESHPGDYSSKPPNRSLKILLPACFFDRLYNAKTAGITTELLTTKTTPLYEQSFWQALCKQAQAQQVDKSICTIAPVAEKLQTP